MGSRLPISADLRPYQKEGISWLAFLRRCGLHGILADDMGLGKTLQSTAIIAGGGMRPLFCSYSWSASIGSRAVQAGGSSLQQAQSSAGPNSLCACHQLGLSACML